MRRNSLAALAVALIALTVVLVATLAACAPDPRIAVVQASIREYNVQLAKGYAQQDMNTLAPVATKQQAEIEYYLMASLGSGKLKMVSQLDSVEFGSIVFPGEAAAIARTSEVWDYQQISTETSAVVRSEKGVTYHLEYRLVLSDGRWLVDSVKSTDPTSGAAPSGAASTTP